MQSVPEATLWIGSQLRTLRVLANLRANEVAQRAGLSIEILSHIECNRRPVTPERAGRILLAIAPTEAPHAIREQRQDVCGPPPHRNPRYAAIDILGAKPDEETRTASEIAKDMLKQALATDPQDEEVVWNAIKKSGVSRSSYMRARKALGVRTERIGGLGGDGKWQLSLPLTSFHRRTASPAS